MGWLSKLEQPRASGSADALDQVLRNHYGATTKSGVIVNADTALRSAAVFACVRIVSEDVAKLSTILWRRTKDGGKERATDHWAYALIHDRPNAWMTAYEWKEMVQSHLELRGNAYAYKNTVGKVVRELLPIAPDKVTVRQDSNLNIFYEVKGFDELLTSKQILHLRGWSLDGINGVTPITWQRENIGVGIAGVDNFARQFNNGVKLSVVLSHPKTLTDQAAKRIANSFHEAYSGDNAYRPAVLEEGMTLTPVSMSNEDAQYIEFMKFNGTQIVSIFRIPQHKAGFLDRSTNNNIEHQAQEYIDDALLPRLTRLDQRLTVDLLGEADRKTYFFETLTSALLKGDIVKRYQAYQTAIMAGFMSRNEARVRENMNPEEGLDEFMTPLNMTAGQKEKVDTPAASV